MEAWIADAVGKMHVNKITQKDVATQMGVTDDYVSMILRGVRNPPKAKERVNLAIDKIIADRSQQENQQEA